MLTPDEIYSMCFDNYLKNGVKLKFPSNTDYTKTYQWRYIVSITEKMNKWKFSKDAANKYIELVVQYVKDANLLCKGLSVLLQTNILEICYDKLQKMQKSAEQSTSVLKHTKCWLDNRLGNDKLLSILLSNSSNNKFPNIVLWYQANKIPPLYLALSKSCCRAINQVKNGKDLLPDLMTLYKIRSEFMAEKNNAARSKEILGEDCAILIQ